MQKGFKYLMDLLKSFSSRWLKFVEIHRVLGQVMLELLMDLILGSRWIWVKLVMDETLMARGAVSEVKQCHVWSRRAVGKPEAKN